MTIKNRIGKSLKGKPSLKNIFDIDNNNFIKPGLLLEDVTIIGTSINSVSIGEFSPGPVYTTTLKTGSDGTGYDVNFYSDIPGNYLYWDSTLGILNISGGLSISDSVDLGNITIHGNTISTTNNSYIQLDPKSTGGISLTDDGSGNMTLTSSGSLTLVNSNLFIRDPILTLGINSTDDSKDRGLAFNYNDGSAKSGFFGYDRTDGYFTYFLNTTNTNEVISGTLGNAKFAQGSFTSLNLNNGSISNVDTISSSGDLDINTSGQVSVNSNVVVDGDLSVTGNFNFSGGVTLNLTVERFIVSAGSANSPSSGSNITFVTVIGSGIASGTMPNGVFDGFFKTIAMTSIASGCSYELTFPLGKLVDPVSGTSVAKKMIFDTSGQSVQIVWDATASMYMITQGGAEIVAI